MQAEVSSVLTKLALHIGNKTYILNKPATGNSMDVTVNSARFKVSFTYANGGLSTIWVINADIPVTDAGTTQSVCFSFSKGTVSQVNSAFLNGFFAYGSYMKTGVNTYGSLQSLLNSMAQTGYTLSVRSWSNSLINATSSVKAATGMKIIKTNITTGRIEAVYYVVVFGDVTGNGVVGDGIIGSDDALLVLQTAVGNSQLGSVIATLAGDVNHNGGIDASDAQTILQDSSGKIDIDQSYVITEVPDECYLFDSVVF